MIAKMQTIDFRGRAATQARWKRVEGQTVSRPRHIRITAIWAHEDGVVGSVVDGDGAVEGLEASRGLEQKKNESKMDHKERVTNVIRANYLGG